jgi:hypothetical protein
VLGFLMKSSLGILCLMLVGAHALVELLLRRRTRPLVAAALYLPPALLASWFACGGTLGALWTHARATWELSSGYFSAMTLSTEASWLPLLVGPLALTALGLARVVPGRVLIWMALPLLPYARYALARADHVMALMGVLAAMLPLLVTWGRDTRRRALLLAAALLTLAMVPVAARSVGTPGARGSSLSGDYLRRTVALRGPGTLAALADLSGRRRRLEQTSRELTVRDRLPRRFRQRIGRECVGIYPWNASLVYANDLRWCPRPVFQSYTAYTPWLDRQNSRALGGRRAPPFVLWTLGPLDHPWTSPQWSIDARYLLSDEPLTVLELLRRYRPVDLSARAALLQRSPAPLYARPRILREVRGAWDRWLAVPRAAGAIVRARVHARRTLSGWLRRNLLWERPTHVTYAFRGGGQVRHRFVLDNAPSGLWIQPYVYNAGVRRLRRTRPLPPKILDLFRGRLVAAVRFSAGTPRAFHPQLRVQWEVIQPTGAKSSGVR